MAESHSYKDLIVWQKSIQLTKQIYLFTSNFPDSEKYTLVSQIRRAAISIPSNIAEGQARKNPKEFMQFLYIARGSLAELETQLVIAQELKFIAHEDFNSLSDQFDELNRMIFALIKQLQNR